MKKNDWIKARTQELYDSLPMTTLKDRESYTNVRDEIIEINYAFFGYVARETYVTDPLVTYDDKFQSAVMNFCDMWAKYKFTPKYRADLSFAVFFKPRLMECIKREFNIIKYSLRRSICMKAAEQLGKPWGKVTKEDVSKVTLSPQEMQILEAIFSTQYDAAYEEASIPRIKPSVQSDFVIPYGIDGIYTENYDNLEDLIVHEMIESESKLDDAYLLKMAEMYGIPYQELLKARPLGEQKLKAQLEEVLDIQEAFKTEVEFTESVEMDE